MRSTILRCTGTPVGVGIAKTKTLAKLANHTAKRLQQQTGGVVDICAPFKCEWVLRNTGVEDIWGVGRRLKAHLQTMGILTAMDLAKADARTFRMKFSVVLEKTARELAGTPCLEFEDPNPPKQEICCSRMFGKRLTEIQPIKEAVATYVKRAAEKLRAGVITTVRLEYQFSDILTEMAAGEALTPNQLITKLYEEIIKAHDEVVNFSSFLRVCCARYLAQQCGATTPEPLNRTA